MKQIYKEKIVLTLKQKTSNKAINLPRDIDCSIEGRTLYINIQNPDKNMQENSVAFEGWVLSIKTWLNEDIDSVELDFSVPEKIEKYGTSKAGHYNRFLYRLYNMSRLFPNWFKINEQKVKIIDDFINWLKQSKCILNQSSRERESVIHSTNMERQIESWFVYHEGKYLLQELWDIDINKIYNQLPMGVFYDKIAAKNNIFTRSASAIDLWGIGSDNNTLHIIELKCGDNKGLGVISELLFYTAVIYDTSFNSHPLFEFNDSGKTNDIKAMKNDGNQFKRLYTHILAEKYHPLFNFQVENTIKNGLANLNIEFDKKVYSYPKK